jgi:hypothetical protein
MFTCSLLERGQNDPRLYASQFSVGIDLEYPVHVLAEVQNHRRVAALTRETGASTAAENRGIEAAAHVYCCNYVVLGSRNDHADRELPEHGCVGGVERPAASIKVNLSLHHAS